MESAVDQSPGESRARRVWIFVLHQFVATLGVVAITPLALAVVAPALRVFGASLSMRQFHWILTETPYFPLQIGFALLLGWSLSRYLGHRSMLWVWVLPFVGLSWLFATNGYIASLGPVPPSAARLSHFFGWGCQPQNRCFDQLATTLPFYCAVAYSVGSLLGRKTRATARW